MQNWIINVFGLISSLWPQLGGGPPTCLSPGASSVSRYITPLHTGWRKKTEMTVRSHGKWQTTQLKRCWTLRLHLIQAQESFTNFYCYYNPNHHYRMLQSKHDLKLVSWMRWIWIQWKLLWASVEPVCRFELNAELNAWLKSVKITTYSFSVFLVLLVVSVVFVVCFCLPERDFTYSSNMNWKTVVKPCMSTATCFRRNTLVYVYVWLVFVFSESVPSLYSLGFLLK